MFYKSSVTFHESNVASWKIPPFLGGDFPAMEVMAQNRWILPVELVSFASFLRQSPEGIPVYQC